MTAPLFLRDDLGTPAVGEGVILDGPEGRHAAVVRRIGVGETIMIGDDMGDVPAFAAARRLGGVGMRVAGEQFGHEKVELESPQRVVAWLERLAERLES